MVVLCAWMLLVAVIVSPCLSAPPNPPNLDVSFSAVGEVEHHLPEGTRFGNGEFLFE